MYIITYSLSYTECSIQPETLFVSANQEGVFECSCNDSNQPLPRVIIWLFNNSVVEELSITRQKYLAKTTNEDNNVTTLTSTLIFVINLMAANVFNDTAVECHASDPIHIILSAKLYVYGKKSPSIFLLLHDWLSTLHGHIHFFFISQLSININLYECNQFDLNFIM